MVVVKSVWQFIEEWHETKIAYNLLYFPEQAYCFQRKMQGSCSYAEWASGFS